MSDITKPTTGPVGTSPVMTHRMILFVMFGLMAGMFLSALDQTVVGTAIRTIGDDLNGLSMQAWVTTSYLIVSTISTPIYGKLSDIFGRRPLFIFAIVIFVIGSILASFSTSMTELAVFRAVQGLGAGGLMSMPLAIMGDILAPRERARYQGYFLAVFGVSSLLGPLIGGLFAGADTILGIAGWRWVFLINVPIGIVALIIVLRFLHIPRHPHGSVRIDWWGATFVIMALVPLLLVAEQGRVWGWDSPLSIACYVIGGIGVIAFVIVETLMKDDALIPLKLFRSPTFSMATVIGVLVGFGMFGAMLTLPLYLQLVLGSTPTESGLQMLPMIVGMMTASIGSGQIIARTGRYRMFPILGTLSLSFGFFWLTFLEYDRSYWFIAGAMLFIGLGLGQLMQTLTIASQNSVGLRDMGVATSASTFFRQIGGTLGTAVLLSLLFATMPANIQTSFADEQTLTDCPRRRIRSGGVIGPRERGDHGPDLRPDRHRRSRRHDDQDRGRPDGRVGCRDPGRRGSGCRGRDPGLGAGRRHGRGHRSGPAGGGYRRSRAEIPVARIADDAAVTLDFSDAAEREDFVSTLVPTLLDQFDGSGDESAVDESTPSTTRPSSRAPTPRSPSRCSSPSTRRPSLVYRVAMWVVILAFVLSLFFKTPPLRAKSALQEAADDAALGAKRAADQAGALVEPEFVESKSGS